MPFQVPDWVMWGDPLPSAEPPPIDTSAVDPHTVEGLVNQYIVGQDDALHDAPDAYFRTTGADAVQGAPAIVDRIDALHGDTLAAAPDDATRTVLEPRLDLHRDEAKDAVGRHIEIQRDAANRANVAERQRLIQNTAARDHADDEKLAGLSEANGSAAATLARMNGQPEEEARAAARSAVWNAAIQQRLESGNSAAAVELFDKVSNQLSPADLKSLETPMQVARHDQTADAWIARHKDTDGPPLLQRAATDPDLHDDARNIVRAKVRSSEANQEHDRAARVDELDGWMHEASRQLATRPGDYKPGTLSKLADEYDRAGEPEKAGMMRRMAQHEGFLRPFASASVTEQQRMIEEMPPGELRDTAINIRDSQAEELRRDAFTAGTSIYPDIGKPVPIDDTEGRIRQANRIAQRIGRPVAPYSVDEIDAMSRTMATGTEAEKQVVQARIDAIPPAMRPILTPVADPGIGAGQFRIQAAPAGASESNNASSVPAQTMSDDVPEPLQAGDQTAEATPEDYRPLPAETGRGIGSVTEPTSDTEVYRTANAQARRLVEQQKADDIDTERMITQWLATIRPGMHPVIPPELAKRLSPRQKAEAVESLSNNANTKTDKGIFDAAIAGLTSNDADERLNWARMPRYRYRRFLSAEDFAKLAHLQDEIDPHDRNKAPAKTPEEIEALDELGDHYTSYIYWLSGSGKPRRFSFDRIDTSDVRPEEFPGVKTLLEQRGPGKYPIDARMGFQSKGYPLEEKFADMGYIADKPELIVGRIWLRMKGTLVINPDRTYSIEGRLHAEPDLYKFNDDSGRGEEANKLTAKGRAGGELFGHRDFWTYIHGDKPISTHGQLPTKNEP